MNRSCDIAVVGSGFAGSLLAMIARQLGRSVVLIERGSHPRVVIGESSTPLSNLLLEELAERYHLDAVRPLAKWGSWQRAHPEVACGLKRGFTFYHHRMGSSDGADPERRDQLLVAASPRDAIADTHWYRADLDHLLVREAQRLGVEYLDRVTLREFRNTGSEVVLRGTRGGEDLTLHAGFVVDATGPRGFLHEALQLGESALPGYPTTQALYSHFSSVGRFAESRVGGAEGAAPYPADDAAVHHVFDGGWIWVLRFNNGITSAGVAATDRVAAELGLSEGESAWRRVLQQLPALQKSFAGAPAEQPFRHMARLSFRSAAIVGSRWALLPSAAGFVDPLLSTGFPLTLLGVSRLAEIIAQDWNTAAFDRRLKAYAKLTDRELLATAWLIGALYATMDNFPVFVAISLLYFAAASYSEAARRLGRVHLASSFLLCDHPVFGPRSNRLFERALHPLTESDSAGLVRDILRAIEPFNVAGLGRPERGNWYPVEASDLLENAHKLEATREEVLAMLARCGFSAP
ncbi:MAG TPA: FAD-dependent oxidoreductase [Acidobacteriaceae bacterium]|nr:FAD-dependent oxidoreductase [Acidobacteriaceae bacterium]